ncbi:hypothetical protein [Kitasatospora sp. NPDC059571]|uniref:hypothetical protein n=1 Tax=Kitasatospora sp. NPDC059571 TaxID=3346871 RepID=UPI0036C6D092
MCTSPPPSSRTPPAPATSGTGCGRSSNGTRPGVGAEETAAQLAACAALWEQTGEGGRGRAWERRWRAFPRLLVVPVGTAAAGVRGAVTGLRLATEENPTAAELLTTVPAGAAQIEDLVQRGPSAPIWHPLSGSGSGGRPYGWTELWRTSALSQG